MCALQTDLSLWQVGLQNFFGSHSLFVVLVLLWVFFCCFVWFFLTPAPYARLNYWKTFRASNCTMKVCWPIFGLCSFQDSVINFQLIMDQNDFMKCEVSSSIRCDQICRVSHFRTRHFHLTPTSCCCSLVASVPMAAPGWGEIVVRPPSPTLGLSMVSYATTSCIQQGS